MDYTDLADIYLGDVSSQVYEFLVRPRPCVFVDAHGFDWLRDPNFAHWAAGPVVHDMDELGRSILAAAADHELVYRRDQETLFQHTFDLDAIPSSARAARGSHVSRD